VDLLKREFPEEKKNEKIVWLLVLLALNLLGAALYFFLARKKEE
jgi:LPXTG-motif cell wall-anchored protein